MMRRIKTSLILLGLIWAAATHAAPPALDGDALKNALNKQLDEKKAELTKQLEDKAKAAASQFQTYRVDMSVPTSPAFSLLGATPATILQPHSPRDLAVSLAQSLSDKDKLGNGVGFDIAPYMLWAGSTLTIDEYRQSASLQRLANLQVSFAAIKQEVAGKDVTKGAIGLTLPLLDEADPRLDPSLQQCFDKAVKDPNVGRPSNDDLKKMLEGLIANDETAFKAASQASADRLSTAWDACREAFKQRSWSGTRWLLGLGQGYDDLPGHGGKRQRNLWTTYTYDMGPKDVAPSAPRGQLLFHLRYTGDEQVLSDTDARGYTLRSGWLYAAGYRYGSDKRNVSIEASGSRSRYDIGEHETSRKLAIGGEMQITKDIWLVLSLGGEGGLKNGKSSPFALASIKYGAASESTGAFGPGSGK